MTDPEGHNAAEDLDEDRLRLDPLEEGMDPPEHWSTAMDGEHDTLDERLREEQPERRPRPEPRDEVDRMDGEGELSGRPVDETGEVTFARDDEELREETPSSETDESSVARELRTPRESR